MGALRVQYAERHPTASNKIRVTWSEPANASDAATAGNYAMSGGVTVSAAAVVSGANLQADLTVSTLAKSTAYTLTVSNVRDVASSTPISSPRNQQVFTWLGLGDDQLDGVPIHGGLIARVSRAFVGDFYLGYNILGVVDTTPPTIQNVTPPPGNPIDRNTPLGFDVVDLGANDGRTNVFVYFPSLGRFEVVYFSGDLTGPWGTRPAGFGPQYAGVRTQIDRFRWRFTGVIRQGGWPAAPVLIPDPIDAAGNEAP